ncbi:MAG: 50S ribosomal protein L9 [Deltaproteobacteria bacterium]|nr:50S ribosomal protein L9 [Candidatus Zymogenaceae bacterium]
MEVILIQDVPSLGDAGDTASVAPGYARNYLIPKKLALPATAGNIRQWEDMKNTRKKAKERDTHAAEAIKEHIEALSITIAKAAGEEDKLFGSVTSSDIAQALEEQGVEVDRRKIVLSENIKRLGDYTVSIKLMTEVTAELKLEVVREEKE